MSFSLKSQLLTVFLGIILLILGVAYSTQIHINQENIFISDFGKFYESTQLFLQNKNPYEKIYVKNEASLKHSSQETLLGSNLNPPLFQLIILPLTSALSFSTAIFVWTFISIVCGIASILLLLKITLKKKPIFNFILGSILLFFSYFPSFINFFLAQLSFILLPFIIGAWQAARTGKCRQAGILLGIAASIKIFLGLFFLYFLVRREIKSGLWFGGTLLICSLIPLLFFGPTIYTQYFKVINEICWYSTGFNGSLLGFLVRLFGAGEKNIPLILIPGLAQKLYWFFSILITAGMIKFLWPTNKISTTHKIDLDFSIILVAMLLLSPLGWNYYFVFLIIPIVFLLKLAQKNYQPFLLLSGIFLFFILTSSNTQTFLLAKITSPLSILNSSEHYFYALLILLGLLFYTRKLLEKNLTASTPATFPTSLIPIFFVMGFIPSFFNIVNIETTINNLKHPIPVFRIARIGE